MAPMMHFHSKSASAFLLGAIIVTLRSSVSAASLSRTINFEAFEAVQICTPLSVLLVPAQADKTGQYTLKIEGESALLKSVQGRVESGKLYIEANASFQIQTDAKLTVRLPSHALKAVSLKAATDVFIAPGFQSPALDLVATSLGGTISAAELRVKLLTVKANGLATITATGDVEKADISADGGATVRLGGLQRKATVLLTGVPTVAIAAQSSDAQIKGTTDGSEVLYNKGSCSLKVGLNGSGKECTRDASLSISAQAPKWTCKATSNGLYTCTATGGTSASSFSSVGSGCSTMTWDAASQNDVKHTARRLRQSSISTSTSTSTSGGGTTTTTTGGNTGASTYTYTSNTPSEGGSTSQTICNFVNNVGSCQVNGTPVPVRQYGLGGVPVPAPSEGGQDVLNQAIAAASSSNSQSTSSGYASPGGTVCTFVNGIGGCTTG